MKKLAIAFVLVAAAAWAWPPPITVHAVAPDAAASIPVGVPHSTPAAPVELPATLDGFIQGLLDAAHQNNHHLLLALALGLFVLLLRTYGVKAVPYFATRRGGVLLAVGGGVLGAVATSVMNWAQGHGFNMQVLIDGISVALTAAGGFSILKNWSQGNDPTPVVGSVVKTAEPRPLPPGEKK
jgi:hypothetical protein